MESTRDEPLTPTGRLLLQPQLNQIINCAISFNNPLNIEAIKTELSSSSLVKHPRFSSLLLIDDKGREYWRRTQVNLDEHIIIHEINPLLHSFSDEIIEEKINTFLADCSVSCPLSRDKPLWEVHLVSDLRCLFLRIHHALGDGMSLMSLIVDVCKRLDDKDGEVVEEKKTIKEKKKLLKLKGIWWTITGVIGFIGRSLCVKDVKSAISGGEGVELWPRMAATAKFSLEDMKVVQRALPKVEGLQLTGLVMVNLRSQPGLQEMSKLMDADSKDRWGNRFGTFVLPIYCHTKEDDPLNYVKRTKEIVDKKKQSLEAHCSYSIGNLIMSLFGPKAARILNYRIVCNTTFMISNMIGPQQQLSFAGNPITTIRVTSCAMPHAVTMHMVSYAGMANMQILVAKDIVPDARFLAKCFENSLLEIKDAAIKVVS